MSLNVLAYPIHVSRFVLCNASAIGVCIREAPTPDQVGSNRFFMTGPHTAAVYVTFYSFYTSGDPNLPFL